MIARHVGQFGWVCPGDGPEHPSHPVAPGRLTTDHVLRSVQIVPEMKPTPRIAKANAYGNLPRVVILWKAA